MKTFEILENVEKFSSIRKCQFEIAVSSVKTGKRTTKFNVGSLFRRKQRRYVNMSVNHR